jgi:hypothetical protein
MLNGNEYSQRLNPVACSVSSNVYMYQQTLYFLKTLKVYSGIQNPIYIAQDIVFGLFKIYNLID